MLIGTVAGTPLGVWGLAVLPAATINRLIGLVLVTIVVLDLVGAYPRRLAAPAWGYGAGALAGVLGGAVGTPGPPVILYAAAQDWSPRAVKANILAFLMVNQAVILIGYWWADLLDAQVWRLTGLRGARTGRRSRRACPSSTASTARASAAWCSGCSSSPAWCY